MVAASRGTRQTDDDGAYDHLRAGATVPLLELPATTGGTQDVVADAAWTVLFLYPATGTPGGPLPDGWLETPGASGCTAEACGFRDLVEEFAALGAGVHGISTQTPQEQSELAAREHVPYPLLSDERLGLVEALRLPTFSVGGSPRRIRRATLLVTAGRVIDDVVYPVGDPAGHAEQILERLRTAGRRPPEKDG